MGSDRGAGQLAAQDDGRPGEGVQGRTRARCPGAAAPRAAPTTSSSGLIAKAVGVDAGEGQLRAVQGRRRGGRGDPRRPRDRGRLGHRRVRRAHQGRQDARARAVRARRRWMASPRSRSRASTSSSATGAASSARPGITPQQRDALVKLVQGRDRDAGLEGDAGEAGLDAGVPRRRRLREVPRRRHQARRRHHRLARLEEVGRAHAPRARPRSRSRSGVLGAGRRRRRRSPRRCPSRGRLRRHRAELHSGGGRRRACIVARRSGSRRGVHRRLARRRRRAGSAASTRSTPPPFGWVTAGLVRAHGC